MTKGPFAMFFGGQDVLPGRSIKVNQPSNKHDFDSEFPDLSNREAGRHVQMLYLVSIIFNLSIISTKYAFKKIITISFTISSF